MRSQIYLFLFIGILIYSSISKCYSQSLEDFLEKPNMDFVNGEKFYEGKIIIVIGEKCNNVDFYQKRIDRMRRYDSLAQVKRESELEVADFNKNLYFYGLLDWYVNWDKYNLPIIKIDSGFSIGENTFTDKLDAVWLVNSDETRRLYIGNSFDSFHDSGCRGAYEYMIIRNGKRILWGNLSNNRYDPKRHINSLFVRPAVLNNNIKLEYFSFNYPDNLTNKKSYFDNLFQIKVSLDKIIDLLELRNPHYTIKSFIYKDIEQKTQLCCHDGYGNAYPEWKEINVVFNENGNNNVLIHESIHILFDNEMNNIDNSCLLGEGIVGYAMYLLDSTKIKKDQEKAILCFDEPIEKWFDERINSGRDIPSNKLYPISAAWVRFLIEKYGLERFKELYKIPNSELQYGYERIYNKSIDELTHEFKDYVNTVNSCNAEAI